MEKKISEETRIDNVPWSELKHKVMNEDYENQAWFVSTAEKCKDITCTLLFRWIWRLTRSKSSLLCMSRNVVKVTWKNYRTNRMTTLRDSITTASHFLTRAHLTIQQWLIKSSRSTIRQPSPIVQESIIIDRGSPVWLNRMIIIHLN